jgi:hypothetical protein
MSTRIVYQVNELQAETLKLTSQLQTKDPFLALSDYLLKAYSPLHHIKLNRSQRSLLMFKTYPSLPEFSQPGPMNIGWSVNTRGTESPILIASLNTIVSEDKPDYVHSESLERYRTTQYIHQMKECKIILEEWSEEDLDVGLILTGCALIDSTHPLWLDIEEVF